MAMHVGVRMEHRLSPTQLLVSEQNARGVIPLTQSELARRLGASRETVNRRLQRWVSDGALEVTAAGVRLLEADRLQSFVDKQVKG